MRATFLTALMTGILATVLMSGPAAAGWRDRYEVYGVEDDDMLKMRAGPGTGYIVIVGLPNGTVVRIDSCEQTGSTRWCKVSLDRAPGLKGYVSQAYLREM
ncbi:SH3 domain-containing protein [Primorskyibacter sp. 2E233]|uniref:SH3 domain-containing protein n=1 Tax=Primorskyibacter sp. 2E233 TaxID=3413431 RepID=UPI003BF12547